jgi:hypothetical protein
MLSLISGVYQATHASSHWKSHEVTVGEGAMFPFCGCCRGEVRFELLRPAGEDRFGCVSFGVIAEPKSSD